MMDREQAKEEVRRLEPDFLQKARQKVNGRNSYICPSCSNGSGSSGTGIALDPNSNPPRYTCFKCGIREDVIGLWKLHSGIQEDAEAFRTLYEHYGIQIDGAGAMQNSENLHIHNTHTQYTTKEAGFTDFFLQANKDIEKTDYYRGVSLDTLNRFKVGYVESWKHPKAPESAQPSPRLIIPVSRYSYVARDTRAEIPEDQLEYTKSKVKGRDAVSWTFNLQALQKAQKPIYVVEGELDALSIIDVGGEAVAIGSTANVRRFLEDIKKNPPAQPLIISLDNDGAGNGATQTLTEGLKAAGVLYVEFLVSAPHKDANEALQADRAGLEEKVRSGELMARTEAQKELQGQIEELEAGAVAYQLGAFRNAIEASKTAAHYSTGFQSVDGLLDGGLYAGLYVVGAITALGKTAFCLQLLDNVAAAGNTAIMFSLEMAQNELISRSISRLTLQEDVAKNKTTAHAKTVRGISTGTRYKGYSTAELELIDGAIERYGEYATRLYIYEGVGDIGIEQIRETVERHVRLGQKPVVLIDYLQILSPYNPKATDKQNTDKAVLELKRLSRDMNIPVIGISSFNRDNYTEPVNLTAFKESGAVEYSSDVLIGLQYEGMDYQSGESEKDRQKRVRDLLNAQTATAKAGKSQRIQIKVLKNRNGAKGDAVLEYFPMFNYFCEAGQSGLKAEAEEWKTLTSGEDIPFD